MVSINYLMFLQDLRVSSGARLTPFFLFLTRLAESPVPFLFLAWIYWCRDKRSGQMMGLTTSICCAFGQALKGFFKVERPWVRDPRLVPNPAAVASAVGYSFPSGHTIRAGAAYGICGLDLLRRHRLSVAVSLLGFFLMIAFSRNWLGVHTLEDVLAGITICFMFGLVLPGVLSWVEKGKNRDLIVCFLGAIFTGLPMCWLGILSNSGSSLGFLIGWVLERRLIRFKMPGTRVEEGIRMVAGGAFVYLLSSFFQSFLSNWMPARYASFISAFFLSLFIMAIWPAFFSRINLRRKARDGVISFLLLFLFCGSSGAEGAVVVIGHRGFAAEAPENTLPSFEAALELGVDYVELDVQMSADGEIVVCHDNNLLRVAGVDVDVKDLSLDELQKVDVGSWFSQSFSGVSIPTLSDVLDLVKPTKTKVYLELKDIGDNPVFVAKVLEKTQEKEMQDRCIFASFQYQYLRQFKMLDPEIPVLLNTSISDPMELIQFPSDYYGINCSSLSADMVKTIHEQGSVAFVWTVDSEEEMEAAISWGVDGICSNKPDLVFKYLESKGKSAR